MYTLAALALLGSASAVPSQAAPFQLVYNGAFGSQDSLNPTGGPLQNFAGTTPFTLRAWFDTSSPNLVAPAGFPGFVAYSPSSATLTVGGEQYEVDTYDNNATSGIAVAIFDRTTFFEPGYYGIGFFQDPLADGAGIVGDFAGASPDFTVDNLVSTTFTGYRGAGFLPGPNNTVVPITLRNSSGEEYELTLAFRIEEYAEGAPLNEASLQAVPEPGSLLLGGSALLALFALRRRR